MYLQYIQIFTNAWLMMNVWHMIKHRVILWSMIY